MENRTVYNIDTRAFLESDTFNWNNIIKKFDSVNKLKNYDIIDGNLVTPVEVIYSMKAGKVIFSNNVTLPMNPSKMVINELTLDEFKESVINNEELIESYYILINSAKSKHDTNEDLFKVKNAFFSNASKNTIIKPLISENDKSPYNNLSNDEILIESELIDMTEIIELIDNGKLIQDIGNRIKKEERERELAIIKEQKANRETVRANQYYQWKLLNEKYKSGEFDEFVD